jgi:hypothetical protein
MASRRTTKAAQLNHVRPPIAEVAAHAVVVAAPVERDIAIAMRLVVVHQPESWPHGQFCQNCNLHWPCRLQRWGLNVLLTAGWVEADIAKLLGRARNGSVPWV